MKHVYLQDKIYPPVRRIRLGSFLPGPYRLAVLNAQVDHLRDLYRLMRPKKVDRKLLHRLV